MQLSPSVTIKEISNENYAVGASKEIAAFVGHFEKGPLNRPIFITTVLGLKSTFGLGVGDTYNDWHQVYNFLTYANGIWVVRVAGTNQINASNTTLGLQINNREDWLNLYSSITPTSVDFFSKSPGTWGNDIAVSVITDTEYNANVLLGYGVRAQDVYGFFEADYFGITVFKAGVVQETFYVPTIDIEQLNTTSTYVYVRANVTGFPTAIANIVDFTAQSGNLSLGGLTGLTDVLNLKPVLGTPNTVINLGSIAQLGYDYAPYKSYDASLVYLTGGLNAVPGYAEFAHGYSLLEGTDDYVLDIIVGNERVNSLAIALAETRMDCIAFVGLPTSMIQSKIAPPSGATVLPGGNAAKLTANVALKRVSASELKNVFDYANTLTRSIYAHFTVDAKIQVDRLTGNARLVNIAGDAAGLKARASTKAPWIPGAGMNYGNLRNLINTSFVFSSPQRDLLQKNGLNYTQGKTIATQKTFTLTASSFDRVNARSLFNHIEKDIRKVMMYEVFNMNNAATRDSISKFVTIYLTGVQAARGIQDFKVVVKTSPTNLNAILADIYVKPTYVAEMINLRVTNAGAFSINTN